VILPPDVNTNRYLGLISGDVQRRQPSDALWDVLIEGSVEAPPGAEAPTGLASVQTEVLARRLERQRRLDATTLLRDLPRSDRERVIDWCETAQMYDELLAELKKNA
jgi:hypothetical protein